MCSTFILHFPRHFSQHVSSSPLILQYLSPAICLRRLYVMKESALIILVGVFLCSDGRCCRRLLLRLFLHRLVVLGGDSFLERSSCFLRKSIPLLPTTNRDPLSFWCPFSEEFVVLKRVSSSRLSFQSFFLFLHPLESFSKEAERFQSFVSCFYQLLSSNWFFLEACCSSRVIFLFLAFPGLSSLH